MPFARAAVADHLDAAQALIDRLDQGDDPRPSWSRLGAELDHARTLAAAGGADLARFDEARAAADAIYAHVTATAGGEAGDADDGTVDGRAVAGAAHAALTTLRTAIAPVPTGRAQRLLRQVRRVGWWIALILMGVLVALCSND